MNETETTAEYIDPVPIRVGGGVNYTYDGDGDRVQKSNGKLYWFGVGTQILDQSHAASQGSATYTYDNENRLVAQTTSGVSATYIYDASGRRVQKNVGSNPLTFYEYNKDGQIYGWLAPGGRELGYAYMNGQVLAQYQNGTTYFHHQDHLGSTRLVSELNQVIEQCNGYYPFGEVDNNQCTPTANNDFTDTLFTGKERDSESNLDNFEARYMASSMGRFMSPDPGNAGADDRDPQTWNAYSYVRDNPLNLTDPDGRATTDFVSCGSSTWGSGGCELEGPRDYALIGRELDDSISNGGPLAQGQAPPAPEPLPPGPPIKSDTYKHAGCLTSNEWCLQQLRRIEDDLRWGKAFAKSFFGDFSLKPTGQAGKYGNCVESNRLDNALRNLGAAYGHPRVGNFLGNATLASGGAAALNAGANVAFGANVPALFGASAHSSTWMRAVWGTAGRLPGRVASGAGAALLVGEAAYDVTAMVRCGVTE